MVCCNWYHSIAIPLIHRIVHSFHRHQVDSRMKQSPLHRQPISKCFDLYRRVRRPSSIVMKYHYDDVATIPMKWNLATLDCYRLSMCHHANDRIAMPLGSWVADDYRMCSICHCMKPMHLVADHGTLGTVRSVMLDPCKRMLHKLTTGLAYSLPNGRKQRLPAYVNEGIKAIVELFDLANWTNNFFFNLKNEKNL